MKQAVTHSNVKKIERRKQWCDRRLHADRRTNERLSPAENECRSYVPRRESDVVGSLIDGEIWWSGDRRFV